MTDCIFCKIAEGKIPSAKVYENERIICFLDINPVNNGHVLIVPKKHYENLQMIPEDLLCEVIKTAKKISPAIIKAVNADSLNIGVNNGKNAGQLVMHFHMHIMPRFSGDGYELWHGKQYKEGEMQKVAERIKNLLK